MLKELLYLSLSLICFASCEEAYFPEIDTAEGHLAVKALITNDPSQNYVHLTKTTSFYDKTAAEVITGASVKLMDAAGKGFQGNEISPGYFHFNTVPVIGQDYKLQILLINDVYESESVTMPPVPSITRFYTEQVENMEYHSGANGAPVASKVTGRELYIDAPVSSALSYYRFGMRSVLEWYYQPPPVPPPPPDVPPVFGWQSLYFKDNYNIAGPKQFSHTGLIEKHPLILLPYSTALFIKPNSVFRGWIFILDQYGTSQGSYDHHEMLNSQFSAGGSLLDPVQTQVIGNITCKTDPSKKIYGYFDLNSYRQYRYYLYFTDPKPGGIITLREIASYPYIPDNGQKIGYPPPGWWEL